MSKRLTKGKRRPHMMGPATGSRLPHRFIFFDVETESVDDSGKQRLKLICACYWRINVKTGIDRLEWFHTKTSRQFYEWLVMRLKNNITCRVMSANIWFDLRNSGLYREMKKDGWQAVSEYDKGMTTIIRVERDRHKVMFVNVQNYFQSSVAEIGQSIGLPKLKVDFKTVTNKALLKYCMRDVEIIYKAISKLYLFVAENTLGSFPYTIASLAFSIYTHSFMKKWLMVHDNKEVLKLERKAYFGGRCECFRIGQLKNDTYYQLDVNSMYPFVMKEGYFPTAYQKIGYNRPMEVVTRCAHLYCYVAECDIQTDLPIYAYRKDGKLLFPVGRFTTFLTTPSLLYAVAHSHVTKIHRIAYYTKAKIFTDFISYFYTEKRRFQADGNPAFAHCCKLIMNSLYGKFGQKTTEVEYDGYNPRLKDQRSTIIDAQSGARSMHTVFMGHETITAQVEKEGYQSMPAIAAHVTDYARIYLWLLIERAGRENVFYVDTDSLIVNAHGLSNLKPILHRFNLGKLKIEKESTNLDIRTAKDYTFGKTVKIKGIPKQAIQNDDGSYTYATFPGMITELRHGIEDDYIIGKQTKRLKRTYDKGEVMIDGHVLPFVLPVSHQEDVPFKVLTWPEWIQKVGGINQIIEKGECKLFKYSECDIKGLVKSKGAGKSFDELRELAQGEERIADWTTLNEFKEILAMAL